MKDRATWTAIAMGAVLLLMLSLYGEGKGEAQPQRKCWEVDIQVRAWGEPDRKVNGVICEKL